MTSNFIASPHNRCQEFVKGRSQNNWYRSMKLRKQFGGAAANTKQIASQGRHSPLLEDLETVQGDCHCKEESCVYLCPVNLLIKTSNTVELRQRHGPISGLRRRYVDVSESALCTSTDKLALLYLSAACRALLSEMFTIITNCPQICPHKHPRHLLEQ